MAVMTVEHLIEDLGRWEREIPAAVIPRFLRTGANLMLRTTRTRLRTATTVDGAPMTPLSPVTRARKGNARIGYASGDLFRSIRTRPIDDTAIAVGSNQPHALWFNEGLVQTVTRRQAVWMFHNLFGSEGNPWRMVGRVLRIPARPFLGFADADLRQLEELAARYLAEGA